MCVNLLQATNDGGCYNGTSAFDWSARTNGLLFMPDIVYFCTAYQIGLRSGWGGDFRAVSPVFCP